MLNTEALEHMSLSGICFEKMWEVGASQASIFFVLIFCSSIMCTVVVS